MITIIQFNTPNIEEYAAIGARINSNYCKYHGHHYIREVYQKTQIGAQEERLFVIRRHLKNYRWVAWIDSDACFINQEKDIEDFTNTSKNLITGGHEYGFNLTGGKIKISMGKKNAGLNTGVFLLRNCTWSFELLEQWINLCKLGRETKTTLWEQGILQWMLINNICSLQENIELINPASKINRQDFRERNKPDICEFILHLWGSSSATRQDIFQAILNGTKPIIPQVDMPKFCIATTHNTHTSG